LGRLLLHLGRLLFHLGKNKFVLVETFISFSKI
jgi:hypothetical protein